MSSIQIWCSKRNCVTLNFDTKTEALQRFKRNSIWKIKLPKKSLNPKPWNQIRWTSVIKKEQHSKLMLKKLCKHELWHQNRSTSKIPKKQLLKLIMSWKKLNFTAKKLELIFSRKVLVYKSLTPKPKHFTDSKEAAFETSKKNFRKRRLILNVEIKIR